MKLYIYIIFFQGREWLTPWLVLMDSYPIIVQFNILPLIDIGGTLEINIHLEMYEVRKFDVVNIIENIFMCKLYNLKLSLLLIDDDKTINHCSCLYSKRSCT